MTTIILPDWLRPQTISPPMVQRAVSASVGRYTQVTDFGDWLQGDTWAMSVGIAPHRLVDAGRVEALVDRLVGGVNLLQCHHFARPQPRGTLRGSPTLSTQVLQGANVLPIVGAKSGANVIANGSFEIDTNSDGLADSWGTAIGGAGDAGRVHDIRFTTFASHGSRVQYIEIMAATNANDSVIRQTSIPVTPSATWTLKADFRALAAGAAYIILRFTTSAAAFISDISVGPFPNATYAASRFIQHTFTTPANAAFCEIMFRGISAVGHYLAIDAVQLVPGTTVGDYASPGVKAGDMLGVGGMLFKAADDVDLNDVGTGSIPTVNRARKLVAAGTPVVWDKPTALWWLKNRPAPNINPGYADGLVLELVERAL